MCVEYIDVEIDLLDDYFTVDLVVEHTPEEKQSWDCPGQPEDDHIISAKVDGKELPRSIFKIIENKLYEEIKNYRIPEPY